MISYVIPTRDRPDCLARTLGALGGLSRHDAEVIVVDNASDPPFQVPHTLENGLPVVFIQRATNEGAAARNVGVRASDPASEWIVMLDDDSHPMDLGFIEALHEQPRDVAVVCAEIFLDRPARGGLSGSLRMRESGGLPEIPIGCGVAYRRAAFLDARIGDTAGYDPSFGFYAEEYDLAARLMRAGRRIVMDRRFQVLHRKTPAGRSMDVILRRLVRNNCWVMGRYAPSGVRAEEVRRALARYARIAMKERAMSGYAMGLVELASSWGRQPRLELSAREWDRFTGKAACRRSLLAAWGERRFATAAVVSWGGSKNEHVVRECLVEMGVDVVEDERGAEALVIGTLSPGPMLDALDALGSDRRVIAPWAVAGRVLDGEVTRVAA